MSGVWRRLGRLPLDMSGAGWACSHAALPTPELVAPGRWNVYLTARDASNRGRIGRSVLTLHPRPRLEPVDSQPVLDPGEPGAFDEDGVSVSCITADGERRYLFYTGWRRGSTPEAPFALSAGVAVAEGGGPFRRLSRHPLLERTAAESAFIASPFVMQDAGRWRMWYVAGAEWRSIGDRHEPCYYIRYAESRDGVGWTRLGQCVEAGPGEHAFGRPWVAVDHDRYRMWFAVRGRRYRIASADSVDGVHWNRSDGNGLGVSAEGWDSEMVEYPAVIEHAGERYMLYNGNDYGRTGIGLAVWDRSPAE